MVKSGALWGILGWFAPPVNKVQTNVATQTVYYNSTYRHGVDEKRRVQIPSKWRPVEDGTEFTVVIWRATAEGPCLRVLPPKQMESLMRQLDEMPNGSSKEALKRLIGSGSVQVPVDKGGRICLPESMARDAGIGNEAVLVGMLDRFEIWSPERYEKVSATDAVLAQEAFKLMG